MIERWIKNKLINSMGRSAAVALLGARQVGKTTLSKSIAQDLNILYLDLESPRDRAKLQDPEVFLEENSDKLIILDEIQRVPEFFMVLRGVIDNNRQKGRRTSQFLLLGSASKDLLRQSAESLAGRISYLEMSGINLLEIDNGRQNIRNLWLRGGFPESYLSPNHEIAMEWLEDIIQTIIERDVPQMGFTSSSETLRRLWTMLAHLQGETINASKLAANLEVRRSSINEYIDILSGLILVRRLNPWHSNIKKRMVKSPRYYIRDSGILHRLLGILDHDTLLSHPILGKSWEGFVIENIHSVLPRLAETYYYRTAAGAEIDLIIKMPNQDIWAIEIKYGHAPVIGKHFKQTCHDVGATAQFVVYGGDDEFPVGDGVRVISLNRIMEKLAAAGS